MKEQNNKKVNSDAVGVLTSSAVAEWVSCRTIGANLFHVYKRLFQENLVVFDYNRALDFDEIEQLAIEISQKHLKTVYFIEHLPHPLELIRRLLKRLKKSEMPELVFHIYGDFTYYAPEWEELLRLTQGCRVRIYCASHRQMRLVQSFLRTSPNTIQYCPFAVNSEFYNFSESLRHQARRKLNLEGGDFVLLYTGRISLQKNVKMAIEEAFRFFAKARRRLHFVMAGDFDNLAAPFFGIHHEEGQYFQEIENLRMQIPVSQGRVTWAGSLEAEELRNVYHAADGFISLSLHHDEDFGMSPAEALSCGLPAVLSDWGGYTSFAGKNDRAFLVPVKVDNDGHFFSQRDLAVAFENTYRVSRLDGEQMSLRNAAAEKFSAQFSIDAVTNVLESSMAEPIEGQVLDVSAHFKTLAKRIGLFRLRKQPKVFKSPREALYKKIYGPYFSTLKGRK